MIEEIIQGIVDVMGANNDSFTFLHADKDFQNLLSDEKVFPAVFLDMPVKYKPKTLTGGAISIEFICVATFLYKSELDDSPSQKNSTMIKCMNAQREFQILLDNHQPIRSFTVGECSQVVNLFDANIDAIVMPFAFVPDDYQSVCP